MTENLTQAIQKIVAKFREKDPKWVCSEHDFFGMYRFLTGKYSHTMKEFFEELADEIALIKNYVETENPQLKVA